MGTQHRITCPGCSKLLKVTLKPEARKVKCPACQAVVRIPALPKTKSKEQSQPEPVEEPESAYEDSTDTDLTGEEGVGQDWGYDDAGFSDASYGEAAYGGADYGGASFGDAESKYEEGAFESPALPSRSGRKRTGKSGSAANSTTAAAAESPTGEKFPRSVKVLIGFAAVVLVAGVSGGVILLSGGSDSGAGLVSEPGADATLATNVPDVSPPEPQGSAPASDKEQVVDAAGPLLEFARNKAAAVDEIKLIHDWSTTVIDGSEVWKLDPDPGPTIDAKKMTELSTKFPGISITGFQPASAFVQPDGSNTPILFNYDSMKGKQLSGSLAKIPAREKDGYRVSASYCPETFRRLLHLRSSGSENEEFQHRILVQEFSGKLLRMIPDASGMVFLTPPKILLSYSGLSEYPGENQRATASNARSNRRLPTTLWTVDLDSGEEGEKIHIQRGGHWSLSPSRRYIIVCEPDAATSEQLTDPLGPAFDGNSVSQEFTVYEALSGQKLASTVHSVGTAGFTGVISADGTRLALRRDDDIRIMNLETGQIIAHGKVQRSPEYQHNGSQSIRWVGGNNFLMLGGVEIMDVGSGRIIGERLRSSGFPSQWLGDHCFRWSLLNAYREFPVQLLEDEVAAFSDPAQNHLVGRRVNLSMEGLVDHEVLRECLKVILKRRCNLEVVTPPEKELPTVEVTYTERRHEGPFSMEQLHRDATHSRGPGTPRSMTKNLWILEGSVMVECWTSDGQLIASAEGREIGLPGGMDFDLPGGMQMRVAALVAATKDLKMEIPDFYPRDADHFDRTGSWTDTTPLADSVALNDIDVEVVEVDNSWVWGDLGFPQRRRVLTIPDLHQFSDKGFDEFQFMGYQREMAVLMRDRSGRYFILQTGKNEGNVIPVDAPAFRNFALHRDHTSYAGFDDKGLLTLGSLADTTDVVTIEVGQKDLNGICFSYDGKWLALGLGPKRGIEFYKIEELRKVSKLKDAVLLGRFDEPEIQSFLTTTFDNKWLIAGDEKQGIVAWDLTAEKRIMHFRPEKTAAGEALIRSVAWNRAAGKIVAAIDSDVVEIDVETNAVTRTIHAKNVVAFSASGENTAVTSADVPLQVFHWTGFSDKPDVEFFPLRLETDTEDAPFAKYADWFVTSSRTYVLGSDGQRLIIWDMRW